MLFASAKRLLVALRPRREGICQKIVRNERFTEKVLDDSITTKPIRCVAVLGIAKVDGQRMGMADRQAESAPRFDLISVAHASFSGKVSSRVRLILPLAMKNM